MARLHLVRNPRPDDPPVAELRRRLDAFYAGTRTYTAFSEAHDGGGAQRGFHDLILPVLRRLPRPGGGGRLRVLELGAGRPAFPNHLGDLRPAVEYHAQDVTPANREYLAAVADRHFIGDVSQVAGPYHLVFSTFVLEHVSAPEAFLADVDRLLEPGGAHVIFCPRYDLPGYVCPSLRHLSAAGRAWATTFLTLSRLASRLDGRPRFWVNCDPSVFHGPWYRDADAVHLVSRPDVERWHRARGFSVERLYAPHDGLRDRILKRHLTLGLACFKGRS